MNPWTGEFTKNPQSGYSPAMLVMLDFTARRYGVRRQANTVVWTCQRPASAAYCQYTLDDNRGHFQLTQDGDTSTLVQDGRTLLTVSGACSVVTNRAGEVIAMTPLN
jgi:hypothetical protein